MFAKSNSKLTPTMVRHCMLSMRGVALKPGHLPSSKDENMMPTQAHVPTLCCPSDTPAFQKHKSQVLVCVKQSSRCLS